MTLRPLTDLSVADWFVHGDADVWARLLLGPPGFEAYARLLYDLGDDSPDDANAHITRDLCDVLAGHTSSVDDCFFSQWDGCGWEPPTPPAREKLSLRTTFGSIRDYHLFAGTLSDAAAWDELEVDPPHLIWPADHAWFVAADVDPDWIGVGGTQSLIDELVAHEDLDVVPATYGPSQPEHR